MSEELLPQDPPTQEVVCISYDPTCKNCQLGLAHPHSKWKAQTEYCLKPRLSDDPEIKDQIHIP